MTQIQRYKHANEFLESLPNLTDVNFFAGTSEPNHHFNRMKHLLKLAGNPDKALKIVHVAGTAGKGTVSNLIHQMLSKAGFKTGVHFSPYIALPLEKIQINGRMISPKDFADTVKQAKPILEKCLQTYDAPSFFEAWLLVVFLYFKNQKCDYVVLETGCGGRYDGTNAVHKTILQIITNIGLDHTLMLGNTIAKIAYEKAGIIRENGYVITGAKQPSALKVIQKICTQQKADLEIISTKENPNHALAIAVANKLSLPEKAINAGLRSAKMPSRFEIVQQKPLVIIDGAHNPDKLKFLANNLENFISANKITGKVHLVFGMTNMKNLPACLKPFKKFEPHIYATKFLTAFRKVTVPTEIIRAAKKSGFKYIFKSIFLDPQDALQKALHQAKKNDIILITGSFFVCSDLRKNWISEEYMLKNRTLYKK